MLVAVMALVSMSSMAQFKFGGGLTMGTKMGIDDDGTNKMGFGINVRGDYYFSEKFSVAPGFTYFFPGTPDGIDLKAWQFNADAHYHFYSTDAIGIYGIGGLNYSHTKQEIEGLGNLGGLGDLVDEALGLSGLDGEFKDGEVGIDLGVGANFGKFFGEVKYDSAFDGQVALTVGILFGGN